jgi:hypothetical protein
MGTRSKVGYDKRSTTRQPVSEEDFDRAVDLIAMHRNPRNRNVQARAGGGTIFPHRFPNREDRRVAEKLIRKALRQHARLNAA